MGHRYLSGTLCSPRGQEVVAELVDLGIVKWQVRAFGTDIRGGNKEVVWQIPLNVEVPLLHIAYWVIVVIGDGEVLHDLCRILTGAERAKRTAYRWHHYGDERKIDGSARVSAVDSSCIRSRGIVHEVVVGVQAEGD